jgi:hypothetical protein
MSVYDTTAKLTQRLRWIREAVSTASLAAVAEHGGFRTVARELESIIEDARVAVRLNGERQDERDAAAMDETVRIADRQLGQEGRCETCGCDRHGGECPEGHEAVGTT